MDVRNEFRRMGFARVGPLLAALLLSGCEGGGGDEDPSLPAETTATNETTDVDASVPADPNFPDGLHPDSEASQTIARVFARKIAPVADAGGNQTNVIVCIGDSITERYYPPYLADETGMTVVNAGVGGERSAEAAARAPDVLAKYRPAYLCILTGINDISDGNASVPAIVANIGSIVNAARANHTIPIVGTLTPLSGSRAEWADDSEACSELIRALAAQNGVRLADVAAAFD